MMNFMHNDWSKCDTMENITIITKWGADTIYTVLMKKYQKYPSTKIPKHPYFLTKVNKSPYESLLDMTP